MKFYWAEFKGNHLVKGVIVAIARNQEFATAYINEELDKGDFYPITINDVYEVSQNLNQKEYAQIVSEGDE